MACPMQHVQHTSMQGVRGLLRETSFDEWLNNDEDFMNARGSSKGCVLINTSGLIMWCNPVLCTTLEYTPSDLYNQNVRMLMPTVYAVQHDHFLDRYAKTRVRKIISTARPVPCLKKSGDTIIAELFVREKFHMQMGSSRRYFLGCFDFNTIHQAFLSTIRHSSIIWDKTIEQFLMQQFECASDMVILTTKSGIIRYMNQAAGQQLGWKPSDCEGKDMSVILPEPYATEHKQHIEEYVHCCSLVATPQSHVVGSGRDALAMTKDGETIRVFLNVEHLHQKGLKSGEDFFIMYMIKIEFPSVARPGGTVPSILLGSKDVLVTHKSNTARNISSPENHFTPNRSCTVVLLQLYSLTSLPTTHDPSQVHPSAALHKGPPPQASHKVRTRSCPEPPHNVEFLSLQSPTPPMYHDKSGCPVKGRPHSFADVRQHAQHRERNSSRSSFDTQYLSPPCYPACPTSLSEPFRVPLVSVHHLMTLVTTLCDKHNGVLQGIQGARIVEVVFNTIRRSSSTHAKDAMHFLTAIMEQWENPDGIGLCSALVTGETHFITYGGQFTISPELQDHASCLLAVAREAQAKGFVLDESLWKEMQYMYKTRLINLVTLRSPTAELQTFKVYEVLGVLEHDESWLYTINSGTDDAMQGSWQEIWALLGHDHASARPAGSTSSEGADFTSSHPPPAQSQSNRLSAFQLLARYLQNNTDRVGEWLQEVLRYRTEHYHPVLWDPLITFSFCMHYARPPMDPSTWAAFRRHRDTVMSTIAANTEMMFSSTMDALVVINQDTEILDCNPVAQQLFQWSKEELVGQNMERIIREERPGYGPVSRCIQTRTQQSAGCDQGPMVFEACPVQTVDGVERNGTIVPLYLKVWPMVPCQSMEGGNPSAASYMAILRSRDTELRQSAIINDLLPDQRLQAGLHHALSNEADEVVTGDPAAFSYESVPVIFLDLVGFTNLCSTMSPQEVVRYLTVIFCELDQVCTDNNITKIKTIGDGYMAVGGIQENSNHLAMDAVRCAMQFIHAVARAGQRLGRETSARVGVAMGPVVAGSIGTIRHSYDVWGDAVNLAARLESSGVAGHVQICQKTYEALSVSDRQLLEKEQLVKSRVVCLKGKGNVLSYLLKPAEHWLYALTAVEITSLFT